MPVLCEKALIRDGVDVIGKRQRHDIGFEPIDDGPSLFAGAAMACLDCERLALFGFPFAGERFVDLGVELARGIVGHIQQR